MTFDVNIYDNVLADMVAGNFTSSTPLNAMLLSPAYAFTASDSNVAAVSGNELSGGSYARFTSTGLFNVATVGDEIQYQHITPMVSFAAFTGTWQYIVIYQATTTKLYLCCDAGTPQVFTAQAFTLDPGTDPFIRILAP